MTTACTTRMVELLEKEITQLRSDFPNVSWEDAVRVVVGEWHRQELTLGESVMLERLLRGLHGLPTATVLDKKTVAKVPDAIKRKEYWWEKLDR